MLSSCDETGVGIVRGHTLLADAVASSVDDAMSVLTDQLGEPDATLDPERYSRIEGQDGWYERPGYPISPSWQYRVVSSWSLVRIPTNDL